ncbi:hypothetical protein ACWGDT_21275 [Streptomyces avermitilis]
MDAHQVVEQGDAEALAQLLAAGSDPDEVFSNMTLLAHAIDVEVKVTPPAGTTPTTRPAPAAQRSSPRPKIYEATK